MPFQDACDSAYTSELLLFSEVVLFVSISRTIRRPPPNQRTGVSLLKLAKGLPWDGQGLVRRGRTPKVTLDAPMMAASGETLRACGSSAACTVASSILPEPTTARDGESDSCTQMSPRHRFRAKTPDLEVFEATKKWRGTTPILDGITDVEMDTPELATGKRALMETPDSGDDSPAEKYWRADDLVAKASMDELTGSWRVDENGKIGEDAATDTRTVDCLCGGGALDKQAAIDASACARTGRGHETRRCGHSAGRVIDFIASKLGLETFEADAVDAYYQAGT